MNPTDTAFYENDHEEMVDREIAHQAELMQGLTREDAEIMAHDRLNPGFGLTIAAEAALYADRRDFNLMRRCTSLSRYPDFMRPAQKLYHVEQLEFSAAQEQA